MLQLNGAPAGYYELVTHADNSVEIGYFGLMPHAIGGGLGRWLLGEAIAEAWGTRPRARLAAHLHPGPSGGPAELPQGGLLCHGDRTGRPGASDMTRLTHVHLENVH